MGKLVPFPPARSPEVPDIVWFMGKRYRIKKRSVWIRLLKAVRAVHR